ncbi:MAG: tetratricopeptide repeat protein [Candidatus Omnitrophota bacterium]
MRQKIRMWPWMIVGILIVVDTYLVFETTHTFYKHYHIGRRLYDEGKYSQALPHLLGAYRMSPENKNVGWKLISAFQQLGREAEARRVLERLSARTSVNLEAIEQLGDMSYSTKAYSLARHQYYRILLRKPSDEIRKKYALALFAEENYVAALQQMDILLAKKSDDFDLRFQHAQIIAALGDHDRASRELNSLRDDGYTKKEALILLADQLRHLGREEEAIKIYREVFNES